MFVNSSLDSHVWQNQSSHYLVNLLRVAATMIVVCCDYQVLTEDISLIVICVQLVGLTDAVVNLLQQTPVLPDYYVSVGAFNLEIRIYSFSLFGSLCLKQFLIRKRNSIGCQRISDNNLRL